MLIREKISLPKLRVNKRELLEIKKASGYRDNFTVVDKAGLVGIEMEIENFSREVHSHPFWKTTTDGSLRNNGYEFVSVPLPGAIVEFALWRLFETFREYEQFPEYSKRCSVHIHLNVRTLSVVQLQKLVILYLVFEKLLFNFVGNGRDKNIHCVPLLQSSILSRPSWGIDFEQFFYVARSVWMKYSALNLLPLFSQGTIEFRQMHGTNDMKKIMTWINLIYSLKLYSIRTPLDELIHSIDSLNSTSQYREFVTSVFKKISPALLDNLQYQDVSSLMSDGVTAAKMLINSVRIPYNDAKNPKYLKLLNRNPEVGSRPRSEIDLAQMVQHFATTDTNFTTAVDTNFTTAVDTNF